MVSVPNIEGVGSSTIQAIVGCLLFYNEELVKGVEMSLLGMLCSIFFGS